VSIPHHTAPSPFTLEALRRLQMENTDNGPLFLMLLGVILMGLCGLATCGYLLYSGEILGGLIVVVVCAYGVALIISASNGI
jgi:hypothetical protein